MTGNNAAVPARILKVEYVAVDGGPSLTEFLGRCRRVVGPDSLLKLHFAIPDKEFKTLHDETRKIGRSVERDDFLDIYYDDENLTLSKAGIFLRLRAGEWSLKVETPARFDGDEFVSCVRIPEIEIVGYLETRVPGLAKRTFRAGSDRTNPLSVFRLTCVATLPVVRRTVEFEGNAKLRVKACDLGLDYRTYLLGTLEVSTNADSTLSFPVHEKMVWPARSKVLEFLALRDAKDSGAADRDCHVDEESKIFATDLLCA